MKSLAVALTILISSALIPAASGAHAKPKPMLKPRPRLSFAVISDIHVQYWDEESHRRFQQALTDLSAAVPDARALVINGDLGNGQQADYEMLGSLMSRLPHPSQVFYTIGNHEYYKAWTNRSGAWNPKGFPNGESERDATGRFLSYTGYSEVYRDQWLEGFHFLFLGSEGYLQSDPEHGEAARLSGKQLQWLESKIGEKAASGKPIFVFLHQPIPNTVAGSGDAGADRENTPLEQLRDLLSRYPQAILFTGHSHRELRSVGNLVTPGFTMVNTSSVYEPLRADDTPYLGRDKRSEGLTVEVYDHEVRIRGRDFEARDWIPTVDWTVPRRN